jgi:hypothetical protein
VTGLSLVIPASSGQASGARAGIQILDPGLRRGDGFVLTNRSELLATSITALLSLPKGDRVPLFRLFHAKPLIISEVVSGTSLDLVGYEPTSHGFSRAVLTIESNHTL